MLHRLLRSRVFFFAGAAVFAAGFYRIVARIIPPDILGWQTTGQIAISAVVCCIGLGLGGLIVMRLLIWLDR